MIKKKHLTQNSKYLVSL